MQTQDDGGRPGARTFAALMAGCFFLLGVINLLNRAWLEGALFISGGLVVLKGREIDRWPRAARHLVIVVVGALAVAVCVRLVLKLAAGG
jgi:hypothetical protein